MEEYKGAPALDAGLLADSQALEHYEISRFCTMNTWASELGRDEAVSLLNLALGKGHRRDSDAESTVLSGALAIKCRAPCPKLSRCIGAKPCAETIWEFSKTLFGLGEKEA